MSKKSSFVSSPDDHPNLLVVRTNSEGLVTHCNDRLLQVTGLEKEQILGSDGITLLVPDQLQREIRKAIRDVLETRQEIMQHSLWGSRLRVRKGNGKHHEEEVVWNSTVGRDPQTGSVEEIHHVGIDPRGTLIAQSQQELEEAFDIMIEILVIKRLEKKDKETEGHSRRVTEMTILLAQAMGIQGEELIAIRRAALLHDIGKLGIPQEILKKIGRLTVEERTTIEKHPVIGYEMVQEIPYLKKSLDVIRSHHERLDGTGYPDGLKGQEIPFHARIFAVIDAWDAMMSSRAYRSGMSFEKAKAELEAGAGTQFDPAVVNAFFQFKIYEKMRYGATRVTESRGTAKSSGPGETLY